MKALKFFMVFIISCSFFTQLYSQNANEKLLESIKRGDAKIAAEAIAAGADVNLTDDKSAKTALMITITYGQLDTAKLLIEKGADVNAADAKGNTPLILACGNNRIEIIKPLIEKGADPDKINSEGFSCMTKALGKRFDDAAKIVMTSGVPFKLTPKLLNYAMRSRDQEFLPLLKEKSVHTEKEAAAIDKILAKREEAQKKREAKSNKGNNFTLIISSAIAGITIIGTAATFIALRKRKAAPAAKKSMAG